MTKKKKFLTKFKKIIRYLSLSKHTNLILISALVGIVVGLVSVGFKYSTEWVQYFAFEYFASNSDIERFFGILMGSDFEILNGIILRSDNGSLLEILHGTPWYQILFMPALGGLIVGLLLNFLFKDAKGAGVEEVMISVATKRGAISFKAVIGKLIASSITIGSGGSAGREGPIVQIGGGIGSTLGRWFKMSEEHVKTLVGAGVAAGIAGAFNAPIAGAFFALEIILGDFALNTFSTIIIASVAATVVSRAFIHQKHDYHSPGLEESVPIFHQDIFRDISFNHTYEFGFYVILGILSGFVCIFFIKSLFFTESIFKKINLPPYIKPAIGGLLVGAIGILFPEIIGVGHDTIETLIKQEPFEIFSSVILGLFLLIGIKVVATSLTLGSGGSGGTIVPSLFLGSVVGALLGILFSFVDPSINPGSYALVGMSAIIAGTTQAPIMAILLFFEVTNNYQIILPVMVVSIISSLISKYFLGGSMYTVKLKSEGIDLYEGMEKTVMSTIKASEIMKKNVYTFNENTPFREILDSFLNVQHHTAFVINDDKEYVGILSLSHMKTMIQDEDVKDIFIASDLMVEGIPVAYPNSSLSFCTELLAGEEAEIIPIVISESNMKLIGYVTRKDILSVYNLEVMKKTLTGIKFVSKVGEFENRSYLDLSSRYRVESIPAPDYFINKTLKSLETRKNYQVTVLAVQTATGGSHRIPDPNTVFKNGDYIVIVGEHQHINHFLANM